MEFDSKIMSSCHLNFLFGAGVNGGAFPQLDGFKNTITSMSDYLGEEAINSGFENAFDKLSNNEKETVKKTFVNEFKMNLEKCDYSNESIVNLKILLIAINNIVDKSENRNQSMKQINIYTLNYDSIVENVLKDLGYLFNFVSASNFKTHDKYFNMVGYDYQFKKYIPTFFVSKIHGDIENPIFPGVEKYESVLEATKFEIMFKMKEKLLRPNSVLIVIGYSGKDKHINKILNDCVMGGLTVFWFKYSECDIVPDEFKNDVVVIENEGKEDTTRSCACMLQNAYGS